MPARILTDHDADLRVLRGKTCAVLGYGAQGHAHALNLRDSGIRVVVGLRRGSRSRDFARKEHFEVVDTPEAVERGEVVFLALPDTRMPEVFSREIAPHLRRGQTLLFAHGFAITYQTISVPKQIDVVMVAPKGLGAMVRREFVAGRGVPGLIAVRKPSTAQARKIALAWAKGIGCTRAGVIETTFRAETETDLFSEQAVLCGGVTALVRSGFDTLVQAGYAPELAYFECLHELKFIVDLMHERGVAGMRAQISETALWGDLTVGPELIDASVQRRMQRVLRAIQSGQFARELTREIAAGAGRLKTLRAEAKAHPIEKVGRRLRKAMNWSRGKKLPASQQ